MPSTKVLTPRGFASLLMRAIQSDFCPEHQAAEARRLADYLLDLAMTRATDAELPGCPSATATQAEQDAHWLEAIAGHLEELGQAVRNVPQN